VSERIGIATAATNHNTRHPMVTAAYALTMQRLTGGRFTLGIGRGIRPLQDVFGMSPITTAQMEDFAGVMRRLFRGETIIGHDGPIGRFPVLRSASTPRTSRWAWWPSARSRWHWVAAPSIRWCCTPSSPDETLARCVRTVKQAAEQAGRDPDAVKVWSCFATVGDHLPEELRLRKTVGRLATYLQAYGDLMVSTNNWDPQVLQRFRDDVVVQSFYTGGLKPIDSLSTPVRKLEHIATLIPDEWLAPAATGSPQRCAAAVRGQLELGADGGILHGATPTELEPFVAAYRG
jgi:alkanesulfonate monooxygenase SsuD/methylene tetrahydromethanopterin reductase-like flavin-dependent oxidoreductase (luciferase family)